jgi:hypothetical protein
LALSLGIADGKEFDDSMDIAVATRSLEIDLKGPTVGVGSGERGRELPRFVTDESSHTGQRRVAWLKLEAQADLLACDRQAVKLCRRRRSKPRGAVRDIAHDGYEPAQILRRLG